MKIAELPYRRNSAELFSLIAGEDWSVFLDSGYPYMDNGRYDIFTTRPYQTIITRDQITEIKKGTEITTTEAEPFALLQTVLGERTTNLSGLPFCGGALGYFAYDLGRRVEELPQLIEKDMDVPDMAIGLYDWAVIVDHHRRSSCLVSQCRDEQTLDDWPDLIELFHMEPQTRIPGYSVASPVQYNMDRSTYTRNFDSIKKYIYEGDCYQVNLTQRFSVEVTGDPWDIYLQLRRNNPAPFSGFIRLPDHAVLSSSPERFLSVVNGQVEARPIKGTIHRSDNAEEDRKLARQLLESEKDRAENLMIVDLLRNDIGKNCETGSVAVPKLFALEAYATVHHLVSTVTGRLAQNRSVIDLLRGCFPGGSITGAPKLRAMEIIEELEPSRRHVYCGSLGYISFDGNMDTNIAIRTLLHHKDRVHWWAGGGIVADSEVNTEYEECFAKAAAIQKLFEKRTSNTASLRPI